MDEGDDEKALYLDVDGVLSCDADKRAGGPLAIDARKVALLNEVVAATGVRVVVSSTWRRDADCRERLRAAGFAGEFARDWRTAPFLMKSELAGADLARGSEIAEHMRRNPQIRRYAILDDDPGMLKRQRRFHVKTESVTGLERSHADRLVAILGEIVAPEPDHGHVGAENGSNSPSR